MLLLIKLDIGVNAPTADPPFPPAPSLFRLLYVKPFDWAAAAGWGGLWICQGDAHHTHREGAASSADVVFALVYLSPIFFFGEPTKNKNHRSSFWQARGEGSPVNNSQLLKAEFEAKGWRSTFATAADCLHLTQR